ncbi:hypothetical protein AYI75_18025 [Shewanella algae]|nr:hypothetical protein AYI97_20695 [Shewanella algae]TWO82941.1 hypothetical protein AYI75_18025 [Shewanella algae]
MVPQRFTTYASLDVTLTEQFSLVEKLRQSHSVKLICSVFGIHRSSYKHWRGRPNIISPEQVKLHSLERGAHKASNGSAGARTLADMVTTAGIPLTRYRATGSMRKLGLVSCQIPQHRYKKADKKHVVLGLLLGAMFCSNWRSSAGI